MTHDPAHPRLAHRRPWERFWYDEAPVRINAGGPVITVVDCVGRARKINPDKDGFATLQLTGAPVYVLGGEFQVYRGRLAEMFHTTIER